jgi:hypothetical protein
LLAEKKKDATDAERYENPCDNLVGGIEKKAAQAHIPRSAALLAAMLIFALGVGIGLLTGVIVGLRCLVSSPASPTPDRGVAKEVSL